MFTFGLLLPYSYLPRKIPPCWKDPWLSYRTILEGVVGESQ